MEWAPWFEGPRCRSCDTIAPRDALQCSSCGDALSAMRVEAIESLDALDDALPISPDADGVAPGNTPLIRSPWLESEADVGTIWVKDEGRNPTGHVTDRDMAIAAAAASLLSEDHLRLASPGRSGVAAAAATASMQLDIHVSVPSRAPFPTKAMINVHGGEMQVVGGRYPDARAAFEDASGWSLDPFWNPYARAGRALSYLELLAARSGEPPDAIVVPTGTGAGITALGDTARASLEAGIANSIPRVVAVQPTGCAPVVEAYMAETDHVTEIARPDTIAGELEIPAPDGGDTVLETVHETGGEAIAVPDPAGLEAAVGLAERTGLSASVAGGVAAAGATDLSVAGPDDTVVVLNPGAGGLDADVLRSHLMSKGV